MKAGFTYFAVVFALGFMLGTVRTLFVSSMPGASHLVGVLIELPIMFAASWLLCGVIVRRFDVAPTVHARLYMGGVAFALLILAEMLVGGLLFGRSPAAHFALYLEASHAIGLAAQVAFALMPLLHARFDRRPRIHP